MEVDVIIERGPLALAGGGSEVKAGATGDRCGLSRPSQAEEHRRGSGFAGGVVLYDGEICASFGDGLYAVPMRTLWGSCAGERSRELSSEADR